MFDPCYEGRMKAPGWLVACSLASLLLIAGSGCKRPQPKTEDEKTFYAMGLMLGKNVEDFGLDKHEVALIQAGLDDAAFKRKPAIELEKYDPKVRMFARTRMKQQVDKRKEAGKVLADAAAREVGAVRTPSGAVVRTTQAGTGPAPTTNDRVKVHYEGRLPDGTMFDSSRKHGSEPTTFSLAGGVIKCWIEGVSRMKVGGKAVLTCPSDTAYGDSGQMARGPGAVAIPGGSALIFDVELVDIVPAPAAPTPAPGMSVPAPGAAPGMPAAPPGAHPH
jgi:FKBP-type peptidyl-prolyl cis-trans isomerase FkpA